MGMQGCKKASRMEGGVKQHVLVPLEACQRVAADHRPAVPLKQGACAVQRGRRRQKRPNSPWIVSLHSPNLSSAVPRAAAGTAGKLGCQGRIV